MAMEQQRRSGGHVREGLPGGCRELVTYDILSDDDARVIDRVTRLEVVDASGWRWYRVDGDADRDHRPSDQYRLTQFIEPGMSGANVVSVQAI